MPTVDLTPAQFFYLQRAVKRDLENLEEMAPWDVDMHIEEYEADKRCGRAIAKLLAQVEQEQVLPF